MSETTSEVAVATKEAPKKVQISKSVLAKQVEDGLKKEDLMAHYGLNAAQMTKVLQAAGLKIRKFHVPAFELIDDVVEEVAEVVETSTTVEALAEAAPTQEEREEASAVTSEATDTVWP
jgi:hypothetical protein